MLCYKDKTFCASETNHHTCGRELSDEMRAEAIRLDMPIAWAKFCKEDKDD